MDGTERADTGYDYTDPSESALRSQQGSGFIGRIFFRSVNDSNPSSETQLRNEVPAEDEYEYTDPAESGLRSGKGSGFISNIFF